MGAAAKKMDCDFHNPVNLRAGNGKQPDTITITGTQLKYIP